MDRLSDCILLYVFYRCPIATFLTQRIKSRSHNSRRWISVKRFGSYLDQYRSINSLSVRTIIRREEMLAVSPSLLSRLTSLDIGGITEDRLAYMDPIGWVASGHLIRLQLVEKCPNLTSLQIGAMQDCDADYLQYIPKSVTRLMLPTRYIPNPTWDDMDEIWISEEKLTDRLPALVECNVMSNYIDPNLKQMNYARQKKVGVEEVSSSTVEHLTVQNPLLHSGDYTLTLHCPNLTTLYIDVIMSDTLRSMLACKYLTHLEIGLGVADMSVFKQFCQLQTLKTISRLEVIRSNNMPQTLTHLDLCDCCSTLAFELGTLPRLLILQGCNSIIGPLPKSLRLLGYQGLPVCKLKDIPLTTLVTGGYDRELPDSLTALSIRGLSSVRHLFQSPTHLPSRLRNLSVSNFPVPESWSFSTLQQFEGDTPISKKQREEFKGHAFYLDCYEEESYPSLLAAITNAE